MIAASRVLAQVNAETRLRKSFPVYQKGAEEFAVIVILLPAWGPPRLTTQKLGSR
jgi:hypothetical protein